MIEIIVALIGSAATIITVILTNNKNNRDMNAKLDKAQAVTDTKLDELTREVRKHNGFAERVPVLEEQMKATNSRLKNLEGFHMGK